MKRYLSFSFALMMSAILIAQTLNIEVGNVIYQIPAEKVGAISITDGATISILDKEFAISDISRMYVDDTEVEIGKDDQFFKKVFNRENALVSEFLHSFVYDSNDYSYTRITDYYQKPFSTDRSYPSPAYIDPFSGMVNYIKTNFNGETINEKIENLWLGLGVQVADIAEFRKLMLE